ncbi:translational machinery protein [Hyphomicrobium sp.]|uniref:translational machinery protein n=1 Tax=Hyphomicrobium sp. TaxID=82 RepID=UPI000FACB7CE|nr:translational machinery protein [Hyphomicrobium sp.]RUP00414.1 MAG: translational machinery protein [Hyphomicrobium sp.]
MSGHFHAVVWIDHHEARIFYFNASDANEIVVRPKDPVRHIHHKANSIGSGHASEDYAYLQHVTDALADAGAILITGPAGEKKVLVDHIGHAAPALKSKIKGVETLGHPTDGELLALARKFFKDDHQEPPRVN